MEIFENFSLKNYNTFNLDVKAEYFVQITSIKEMWELLQSEIFKTNQSLIIGEGSNILFRNNFTGIAIHPDLKGVSIIEETEDEVFIEVGAGEKWDDFVVWSIRNGYSGVENLSLIPGAVGSAPVQNIGAYGVEVKDVIHAVNGFQTKKPARLTIPGKDCEFGYRTSIFKKSLRRKFIVDSVIFKFRKHIKPDFNFRGLKEYFKDLDNIKPGEIRSKVIELRMSKLPDPDILGNAGSFFKNPVVDEKTANNLIQKFPDIPHFPDKNNHIKFSAAWLIEQCGWKGKRNGDAGVYTKHALILVNYGKASGQEIYDLSEEIFESVFKKFAISLEREVQVVG